MTNLCIRLYRYLRAHRVLCWGSMVLLFVFFGFFASRIHLEEDLNKLMPQSRNEDGSLKLAFADLRIKDKTFLLFENTGKLSTDEVIETCDSFVDSLMAWNDGLDTARRVIDDVFYAIPEEIEFDAIDYVTQHLPSFIDTTLYASFDTLLNVNHMRAQMQRNRDDLLGPIGSMMPELIEMDPLGVRDVFKGAGNPLGGSGTGSYILIDRHFFTRDTTVCVAFITPHFSGTNTGLGSRLFEQLNHQIDRFSLTAPGVKIVYHGTPASGFYNAKRIKTDIKHTLLGALLVVLLFIMVSFRNRDTLLLLLLPVIFGVLVGLALMYFIKGQFSLLALGIGAVVLGVAFSYVLHILTHFKYVTDPEQVLRDEVKPVCLGCLTTIGSFAGLMFTNSNLLQDFGLFASFAIAGTTLFCITYLPQMLNPAKNSVNKRAFALFDRINNYPFDRNKVLNSVLLLILAVCIAAFAVKGTQFDANMHNLGYKEKRVTYSEELLRDKTYTGDKTKSFASSGKTMEEALENFATLHHKLDSLQRLGLVKSFTPTDALLVPLVVQQSRIDAWQRYWNPQRLGQVRQLINATAPAAELNPAAFEPFYTVATAQYKPDALYKAGLIPDGFLSTLMEKSWGGEYLCFTSVRCANDTVNSMNSDYYRICDAIASSPNLLVLDTYYYTTSTLRDMYNDFNVLQWVSMLLVFIVLLLSFRFNLRYTVLGFMPVLLSWLVVLGAMAIFDVKFNLINIIISTFVFGIGVDYSIFVMNGLIAGDDRRPLLVWHKTAVLLSAVILLVTVGSMLLAVHPAIRSVGFTTLTGLVSAVVLVYTLLPAAFRLTEKWGRKKAD